MSLAEGCVYIPQAMPAQQLRALGEECVLGMDPEPFYPLDSRKRRVLTERAMEGLIACPAVADPAEWSFLNFEWRGADRARAFAVFFRVSAGRSEEYVDIEVDACWLA